MPRHFRNRTGPFAIAAAAVLLCACQSPPLPIPPVSRTPYETNASDPALEGIPQELLDAAVPASQLSKAEFLSMTTDETRAFVATQIPNYRSYFGIEDGYEMTDEKWESAKTILAYQFYGSARLTEEEIAEYVAAHPEAAAQYEEEEAAPADATESVEHKDYRVADVPMDILLPTSALGMGLTDEEAELLDHTPEEFEAMSDEEIAKVGLVLASLFADAPSQLERFENPTEEDIAGIREAVSQSCYSGATLLKSLEKDLSDMNAANAQHAAGIE